MKFVKRLYRELPENFTPYLLQIDVLENADPGPEGHSRNFTLYSLQED
jgi:hypothetical protein